MNWTQEEIDNLKSEFEMFPSDEWHGTPVKLPKTATQRGVANLICHRTDEGMSYTWEGKSYRPILVTLHMFNEVLWMSGTRLMGMKDCPFTLRWIMDDIYSQTKLFARSDGWRFFTWLTYYLRARLADALVWIARRVCVKESY